MLVTGGTNGVHAAGAAAGPEVNGSVVALGEIEPPRGEGVKSRLATVLRVLARATAEACGVDRCSIFVPRGDVLVPLMSQFAGGPARPELWQMFKALETKVALEAPGIVAAVLAARRPRLIVDVPHDPRVPADWKRFGAATLLLVPLVRDDAVVGLMALDTTAPSIDARQRRLQYRVSLRSLIDHMRGAPSSDIHLAARSGKLAQPALAACVKLYSGLQTPITTKLTTCPNQPTHHAS